MSKGERNIKYDILRVFATLLVIMDHVAATWKYGDCYNMYWKVSIIYCCIAVIAVPLFFMISGACIKNYTEKELIKKIIYYAAVFTVTAFLYKLYEAFMGQVTSSQTIILDALAYPKYHLWFLPAYIFVLGISTIILRYIESGDECLQTLKIKYKYVFLILSANVFLANVYIVAKGTEYESRILAFNEYTIAMFPGLYGCFYFMMGRYLSTKTFNRHIKKVLLVLSIISFVILYKLTSSYSRMIGIGDTRFIRIECVLVIIISSTVFLIIKELNLDNIPLIVTKIIRLFTICTFGIYLIHPLVIDVFNTMGIFNGWQILRMEITPWVNMPLRVMMVFTTSFIIVWILLNIKETIANIKRYN